MDRKLSSSIRYLKGIGPKRAKSLAGRGINTAEDLLYYFPRRYEDRSNFLLIGKIQPGDICTVKARVITKSQRRSWHRKGLNILEAAVEDESGKLYCVWFNQPYLTAYIKPDEELILYGKIERYGERLQMTNPEFEAVNDDDGEESLGIGRIVPIYTLPENIGQRAMRTFVHHALKENAKQIRDCLPYDLRAHHKLMNIAQALFSIHFPENEEGRQEAYRRLSFEEFFLFQLPLALRKLRKHEIKGFAHKVDGELVDGFLEALSFRLTSAQEKAISEIKADMAKPMAMQRLLQGDVGSGKTVIATIASLMAIQGGYQAAFMVPTEILARQHFERISSELKNIKIALLTGSIGKKEKTLQAAKNGEIDLIIGTHALLEEQVIFRNLGLVIVDEQHKFGVGQRALLPQKGVHPDVLIMTATPIPRTLAITLYGDMDISVINEMPTGRLPVETAHFTLRSSKKAYEFARSEIRKGNQVFIVYPVIEESFTLDITGAKKMYAELKKGEFKDFKIGLIHGKLKQDEQDEAMHAFSDKKLDILIATTVLEVGIDIPSATCMIIAHAERFGLAQLHQLRGRVGRGMSQSYCILISDPQTAEAKARIAAMVQFNDGFRIAEEDLKIRGPGEFFGSRQSGLTELKIGNPLTQMQLLKLAREEAIKLVATDPNLLQRQNTLLKQRLIQRFPGYEKLMVVG